MAPLSLCAVQQALPSGGQLAASVALQARDLGSFTPVLQLLAVPALDLSVDAPDGTGMISATLRGLVRRVYFPDAATRRERVLWSNRLEW